MSQTQRALRSQIHGEVRPLPKDLFGELAAEGVADLHIKYHAASRLRAIVAIHDTRLGPALGGCRCLPYGSTEAAIADALRLARGMTLKAAFADLPFGGGKAVLIEPEPWEEREAAFEAFGGFVEELGGRYITAVDSGTSSRDMDVIARRTSHVLSRSRADGGSGDPSPFTAHGVRLAIQVAVSRFLGRRTLQAVHVAIQGVGQVGYALARELHRQGARLSVADSQRQRAERCRAEFAAEIVDRDAIYDLTCDVFAPCALGGVVNDASIGRFNARIIAGAANNQLAESHHADRLQRRGIVYLPDFVINSAGLLHVLFDDPREREHRLRQMVRQLTELLERALHQGSTPLAEATAIAERRLIQRETADVYQTGSHP